mgnify:FL=1
MEQKLIYYSRLRLEFEALVVQKKICTQAQLEKNEKGDYSNIITEAIWIRYKLRSMERTQLLNNFLDDKTV